MDLKKILVSCATAATILIGGHTVAEASTVNPNSIVDHLISVGEDHSFDSRTELAKEHDIKNYIGSAEQNLTLLSILRDNKKPVAKEVSSEPKKGVKKQEGRTITVQATAYTAYCEGCSGITYTGQNLRENPNLKVIAVDPNVIPLGSVVYVEGYGNAIAGDIGGAIKGNRIDVFIPNYADAISFGRKTLNVTILN
jgi:3D (Asp-Asp-Asp) domain-containing protein